MQRNKILKSIIVTLAVVGVVLISLYFYLSRKYSSISPITSAKMYFSMLSTRKVKMAKETIGFMPYWLMDNTKYVRSDLMSEVIYFSLTVTESGDILKVVGNQTDPGWRWWNSQSVKEIEAKTKIYGGKFSVAFAMQDNDTIESFLDDPKSWDNFTSQVLDLVRERDLDGVNIDFEYVGDIEDDSYRSKFTSFSEKFTNEVRKEFPGTVLSVDLYALSARNPRLTDVSALASLYDRLIVMSYDYYASGSDISGPVAPMGGFAEGIYYFDIKTTYEDYTKLVSKEKIIMGIPYYTWDYPVEEELTPKSPVLPQNDANGYTSILSYGRFRAGTDIDLKNCTWDELAQSNWCHYIDPVTQKPRQTWLEDNDSLRIKFDYAKDMELGGIAIWALGYDREYPDLWEMMDARFTQK